MTIPMTLTEALALEKTQKDITKKQVTGKCLRHDWSHDGICGSCAVEHFGGVLRYNSIDPKHPNTFTPLMGAPVPPATATFDATYREGINVRTDASVPNMFTSRGVGAPVKADTSWRAWQHNVPGECACGIPRSACTYHFEPSLRPLSPEARECQALRERLEALR